MQREPLLFLQGAFIFLKSRILHLSRLWFVRYSWWDAYGHLYGAWFNNTSLQDVYGYSTPLSHIYKTLGTYTPPAEKVTNGNFETYSTSGWSSFTTGTGVTGPSIEEFSGVYGAYLGGGEAMLYQTVTGLSPNTTYQFTVQTEIYTTASSNMQVGVSGFGNPAQTHYVTATDYGDGMQTFYFYTGPSSTSATIWFYVNNSNTYGFFDQVSVREYVGDD
jgi:hypothetical protein